MKSSRPVKFKPMKTELPYPQSYKDPSARLFTARSRNNRIGSEPISTTWLQVQSQICGTDPTAPHLKYGVFPQRRNTPRGRAIQTTTLKPLELQATISEYSANKRERKRTLKKTILSEAPVFVFRTKDKKCNRHLSQSEILHIDIKPRRNPPISPMSSVSPAHMTKTPSGVSPSYLR